MNFRLLDKAFKIIKIQLEKIILKKYSNISEKEEIEIKNLKRGEALIFVGENHLLAEIKSFEFEDKIINEKREEKIYE